MIAERPTTNNPAANLPAEWRVGRPLGTSRVSVPRLGVGLRGISRDAALNRRLLARAYALGFRHFDAAPSYGFGSVEVELGLAAEAFGRSELVLSIKAGRLLRRPSRIGRAVHRLSHITAHDLRRIGGRVARRLALDVGGAVDDPHSGPTTPRPGRLRGPGGTDLAALCAYSYDGVMRSLEESLGRLGTDHVEIVYLHDPEVHVGMAMRDGFRALESLRRDGTVGAIGVSLNDGSAGPIGRVGRP